MREILGGRYAVDVEGNVYSLRNNAGNRRAVPFLMKSKKMLNGYHTINVYVDIGHGLVKQTRFVHRLVAEGFVPNPNSKPEVNHLDGNKCNNVARNLEWVTAGENALHAFKIGLRVVNRPAFKGKFNEDHPKSKPIQQLTLEGEPVKVFPSAQEAQRHGFSQSNISSVIAGNRKSHKGYKWAFA